MARWCSNCRAQTCRATAQRSRRAGSRTAADSSSRERATHATGAQSLSSLDWCRESAVVQAFRPRTRDPHTADIGLRRCVWRSYAANHTAGTARSYNPSLVPVTRNTPTNTRRRLLPTHCQKAPPTRAQCCIHRACRQRFMRTGQIEFVMPVDAGLFARPGRDLVALGNRQLWRRRCTQHLPVLRTTDDMQTHASCLFVHDQAPRRGAGSLASCTASCTVVGAPVQCRARRVRQDRSSLPGASPTAPRRAVRDHRNHALPSTHRR